MEFASHRIVGAALGIVNLYIHLGGNLIKKINYIMRLIYLLVNHIIIRTVNHGNAMKNASFASL